MATFDASAARTLCTLDPSRLWFQAIRHGIVDKPNTKIASCHSSIAKLQKSLALSSQ
jgi:hypothetical protein